MVSQSMPCLSISSKIELDQQSKKIEANLQSQLCYPCHKPEPYRHFATPLPNYAVIDRQDYENCCDLRFMNPRMYQDVSEMDAAGKCTDRGCTNCYDCKK